MQIELIKTIHETTSQRIAQILAAARNFDWIDPLETINLPGDQTKNDQEREIMTALMTMHHFNESHYLWQPLHWFGLLEVQMQPWMAGLPILASIRPTPLGRRLLPTLALQDTSAIIEEEPLTTPPVGRNEPCPCGATLPDGRPVKYKKCHGR